MKYTVVFNYGNRFNSRYQYAVADQDGRTVFHGLRYECEQLVRELNK